jgi:hypothetical protein
MGPDESDKKENKWPDDFLDRSSKSLAGFAQRAWPPSRDFVNRFLSQAPISKWGKILLIAGLCIAAYYLFIYSTIVSRGRLTEFGYLPINYVYSANRLQNRELGAIAGMIMAALGALILVIENKIPSDRS